MAALLQIAEPDRGRQMVVYIMPELFQVGCAGCGCLFGRQGVYEKFRQDSGDVTRVPQFIFQCAVGAAGKKQMQLLSYRGVCLSLQQQKGRKGHQRLVNGKKPPRAKM